MMYQHRPTIVEAFQFNDYSETDRFLCGNYVNYKFHMNDECGYADSLTFSCKKANGPVTILLGDWLIKESDGVGLYPCTKDDFEKSYIPVGECEHRYTASDNQGFPERQCLTCGHWRGV